MVLGLALFLGSEWINEFVDDFGVTAAARHHLVRREAARKQQQAAKDELMQKMAQLKTLRKGSAVPPPPAVPALPPPLSDPPPQPQPGVLPPPEAQPVDLIPVAQAEAEAEAAKTRVLQAEAALNEAVSLKETAERRRVASLHLGACFLGALGLALLLWRVQRPWPGEAWSLSFTLLLTVRVIAAILLAGIVLAAFAYWSGVRPPVAPWVLLGVVAGLLGGLLAVVIWGIRAVFKTKSTGCIVALLMLLGLLLLGFLLPLAYWWLARAPTSATASQGPPSSSPATPGTTTAHDRIIRAPGTYPLNKRFTLEVPMRAMRGKDGASTMRSYTLRSRLDDGASGVTTFAPLAIGPEAFGICWDGDTNHLWLASPSLLRWHHLPETGPPADKLFMLTEIPLAYWRTMPQAMREALGTWGHRADDKGTAAARGQASPDSIAFFLKIPQQGTLTFIAQVSRMHDLQSQTARASHPECFRLQSVNDVSMPAWARAGTAGQALPWGKAQWLTATIIWHHDPVGDPWIELLSATPMPDTFSPPGNSKKK